MAKTLISMRLDQDLLDYIDHWARIQGLNRTSLVTELFNAIVENRLKIFPRKPQLQVWHPDDRTEPHS